MEHHQNDGILSFKYKNQVTRSILINHCYLSSCRLFIQTFKSYLRISWTFKHWKSKFHILILVFVSMNKTNLKRRDPFNLQTPIMVLQYKIRLLPRRLIVFSMKFIPQDEGCMSRMYKQARRQKKKDGH